MRRRGATAGTIGRTARPTGAPPRRRALRMAVAPRVGRRLAPGYSRFVSAMKVMLPAVAVALVALVVMWPHLNPKDQRFAIGFATVETSGADDPSMVNARYLGTTKSRQPFSITADLARNVDHDTSRVELEMPKADITLDDGSWLVLTAETGVYNHADRHLTLVGAVNLFHDSGYEFRTSEVAFDLAEGVAVGTVPVSGQGPFGDLKAEGFRLIDRARTISFAGKARLVLYPGLGEDAP